MPSRAFHTKSRLGCTQCKARRVRCDQRTPVCVACERRSLDCSYLAAGPPQPKSSASTPTSATSSRPSTPAAAPAITENGNTVHFDLLDLYLMHHYSTATGTSLLSSSTGQRVWAQDVPKRASANPLLMHGLLAVAGMHLAVTDPASKAQHHARALQHQQSGLSIFRGQLAAWSPTMPLAQQEAPLIFSAMLVTLTFAHAHVEPTTPKLDMILELFTMFRGVRTLWAAGAQHAPQSIIRSLFLPEEDAEATKDFSAAIAELDALETLCRDNVRRDAARILRQQMIEELHYREYRLLGLWPTVVSDDYMNLLKERDSVALQILAHYGTILASLRSLWWMGDWHKVLQAAVESALHAA